MFGQFQTGHAAAVQSIIATKNVTHTPIKLTLMMKQQNKPDQTLH